MELTQDDVIRILKLIDESPMGRVSLQVGDLRLEVAKGTGPGSASAIPAGASQPAATNVAETRPIEAQPLRTESAAQQEAGRSKPKQAAGIEENLLAIKAPLLGIFYRRPQPGSPPYVEEGSLVDENTTVALIEVMKLFNPVRAGVKGRIHEICAETNELVEYDQVLFLVKPE